MATVPIEIILQDAETPVDPTPTPTPENGEETNIVVPSTGTISNDGNSNGGIGSTISIILPIVIAVLALGAMVALLVRRQQKRKKANDSNDSTEECNAKISKKEKLATAASGTIAILAATVLVGNLVIPATKAATNVEPGTAELDTVDKITITATREIDSDITVATVKNTSYATANLDFGYKVTASMSEGTATANLYLDGNTDSPYYIAPVSDGTLTDNTWGYTLSEPTEESSYLSIPLEDTPTTIVKGSGEIEDEAVDIYYTIKVDKSLPAGTYTGELEYSIAPAVEYMQDFAAMTEAEKTATLANMPEGEQYILKDIRDEKSYYISKLADGDVWMTQNLDLDIVANKVYNDSDTDLPPSTSWTPTSDEATHPADVTSWSSSYATPESYDPGNLYWNGAIINDQATCEEYGGTWQTWPWEECRNANPTMAMGDSHYHIGNYYNWTAAVAMSDSSSYVTDQQGVNQSICPAGWRLPTYSGDRSYENLVSAGGLTAGTSGNIQNGPTYFVYGGYWAGSFDAAGRRGYYWSSVVRDNSGAYYFGLDVNGHLGQSGAARNNGYLLRCVAR